MHTRDTAETHTHTEVIRKIAPLDHIGHLLHKAIWQRPRDIGDLHNTYKQTQRDSQNSETKKHVQNKRKREKSRKKY